MLPFHHRLNCEDPSNLRWHDEETHIAPSNTHNDKYYTQNTITVYNTIIYNIINTINNI